MVAPELSLTPIPWTMVGDGIFDCIERYPPTTPMLMLGSERSRLSLLALAWDELSAAEVLSLPLPERRLETPWPWTLGIVGLIPYDAYNPWTRTEPAPQRYFRVRKALWLDSEKREAMLASEALALSARWQIPEPWTIPAPAAPALRVEAGPAPQWHSSWTDGAYLDEVEEVLEEIRSGRYYQLNLLRYWQSDRSIERPQWCRHLRRWAGPYAAYIDFDTIGCVSFSPERFVSLADQGQGAWSIHTYPIKGTRAVLDDPEGDAVQRSELASHPKDRAELSMIIDLMRNDLQKICRASSVRVEDPGSVQSFSNVHHLVAAIKGDLQTDLTIGDLLQALCPGGSITGAPKREVMAAIREKEGRERGYFMGHLFYFDAFTGRCDSSIAIRTALKLPSGRWEFAAGSGLVIHSQAEEEMAEVTTKARVVLESLGNA